MTHPDCENPTRQGDCLTRWARVLCDSCDSLLSDDERTQHEIAVLVSDLANKARLQLAKLKGKPTKCLTLRENESRSCTARGLVARCGFCVSQMSESDLIDHATKVVQGRNESREHWRAEAEAAEYAASLGIDLKQCWNVDFAEFEPLAIFAKFQFSKPCFVHPQEDEAAA